MERERWSSYTAFILASITSVVGLGSFWRFPYIVGANGGGTFLLVYLIINFSFGLALMTLELAVGRYYQTSLISCFESIKSRFKFLGIVIVGIVFVILSYYLVIIGFTLLYFIAMLSNVNLDFNAYTDSWYPLLAFLLTLAMNYLIIRSGMVNGIERVSKIGVYALLIIMVPLTMMGLSLPNADKGLEFYLMPKIERFLDPHIWTLAFGQAFFALSIGMGILLTYSSYLHTERSPIISSLIIISSAFLVAFTAGLMIFSIIFAFGLEPDQGTRLVFIAMPMVFASMPFGSIIGISFFFLLFIVGLTSSISMYKLQVASLEDAFRIEKRKAMLIIAVSLLVAGVPSALSYSKARVSIAEYPLLDLLDYVFGTFGLPIAAVIFTIIVTWFIPKDKIMKHVNSYGVKIPDLVFVLVKIAAPILIIATIIAQLLNI